MSDVKNINTEASEYVEKMRKELRTITRDWESFAGEVPQKFMQLIKSGMSTSLSKNPSTSGSRQIGLSLNFNMNTDAAKEYIEGVADEIKARAEKYRNLVKAIDEKVTYFHTGGVDSKNLSALVKLLVDFINFLEKAELKISQQTITFDVSKEVKDLKTKWTKIENEERRKEEAKRLGVDVKDLDNHKKYLETKRKQTTAKTSAAMSQVVKSFTSLGNYLDAATLKAEAEASYQSLKEAEEAAERERIRLEEERKAEEERQRKEKVYNDVQALLKDAKTEKDHREIIKQLETIKGYKDVDELIKASKETATTLRKTEHYDRAMAEIQKGDKESLQNAVKSLKGILDFKDAKAQMEACEKKIKDILEAEEAERKRKEEEAERERIRLEEERIERERLAELERIEKEKKKKKMIQIGAAVVGVILALVIGIPLYKNVIHPSMQYGKATNLLEDKEFDAARVIFEELGYYEDSNTMVKECLYQQAADHVEKKEYVEAIKIYEELEDYKDSYNLEKETNYTLAMDYFEAKDYENAINCFYKHSFHKDSKAMLNQSKYLYGIQLFEKGEYEEGFATLMSIRSYEDAKEQAYERYYLQGVAFYEAKEFEKANPIFRAISGYKDSELLIHEHEYVEEVVSVLSCEVPGEIIYTCACEHTYTETTEALGHDYTEATCTMPSSCKNCQQIKEEALGHTTDTGVCDRCGFNFTAPIILTGSNTSATAENKHTFSFPKGEYRITISANLTKKPNGNVDRWSVEMDGAGSLYFGYSASMKSGTFTVTETWTNDVTEGNLIVKMNGSYTLTIAPVN